MGEPQWKYRSYVVYATFPASGENSAERRFAYDARSEEDYEPCVDWSDAMHGRCLLHYGNAVEALADAERKGATDVTIRHVELGAPVTPEELSSLKRQVLISRLRMRHDDLMLLVGLTEEDVALLWS